MLMYCAQMDIVCKIKKQFSIYLIVSLKYLALHRARPLCVGLEGSKLLLFSFLPGWIERACEKT